MKAGKLLGTLALGAMLSVSACQHYSKENSFYFNSGSALLTAKEKSQITQIAKNHMDSMTGMMGDHLRSGNLAHKKRIHVISYTDSVGNKAMNEKLAKKRATAVKQVLMNAGINKSDIVIVARGEGIKDQKGINNPKLRRVDVSIF